jgi:hypothetical protein
LLTILILVNLYPIESSLSRSPSENTFPPGTVLSLPGGYYDRDIRLTITSPNPNATLIFTVDGSVPTPTVGTTYTRPILLSAATPAVTVIRARAVLPDGRLGPVASASYFVGVTATLPMISLIVEPDDLWDLEHGIYANFNERGATWERPVDVTYVGRDPSLGFHVPAGVRIHGGGSRVLDKKSLRLYFRQEYGLNRLEYPLFASSEGAPSHSSVQSFKRLVLHSGTQDGTTRENMNWTLIRNQLTDRLAFQLNGYATRSQPALLFINGDPWGIYQIRERIDRHFLENHYGIESADLLEAPEMSGERNVSTGDSEHWDHLMQFVETHNLAAPTNYGYVESQVDIANFIDYNVVQIYAANADWPRQNVRQFRARTQGSRWQWVFWDTDSGFAAHPVCPCSYVDTNSIRQVMDFVHYKTDGRDTLLLRKLLENPVFFDRFLARTADLLNTTLAPSSVIAHIDALAAELEPDIAYETIRWSSSTDWKANVQELRDFARRRPDFVRQHIIERFGLDGTARITFNPPSSGSGYVAISGSLLPDLPWSGVYFLGIPVRVTAAPAPGYRFTGWDPPSLPQTPVVTLTVNASQTITPRFEAIGEDTPRPGDVVFTGYHVGADSHITESWFELRVMRPGGVDLRGWRITDNDAKTTTDEGSLIFGDDPAFARVPPGTAIRVILPSTLVGGIEGCIQDNLNTWERQMVLCARSPNLDTDVDPGFNLGPNDNLVLLAPGPTQAFDDDRGIAFISLPGSVPNRSPAVTPASFGVLVDGVLPTRPN